MRVVPGIGMTEVVEIDRRRLVEKLRRKSLDNLDAGREPPALHTLMDRARTLHEHPEMHNSLFLDFLWQDYHEAMRCMDAIREALEHAPKLKPYRRRK